MRFLWLKHHSKVNAVSLKTPFVPYWSLSRKPAALAGMKMWHDNGLQSQQQTWLTPSQPGTASRTPVSNPSTLLTQQEGINANAEKDSHPLTWYPRSWRNCWVHRHKFLSKHKANKAFKFIFSQVLPILVILHCWKGHHAALRKTNPGWFFQLHLKSKTPIELLVKLERAMKNVCHIGLYSWHTKWEFPGILDRLICYLLYSAFTYRTYCLSKTFKKKKEDRWELETPKTKLFGQCLLPVTYSNMGLKIKLATFNMGRSYATYDKDIKAIYGIGKTAQMRPAWSTQRVPAQSGPRSETTARVKPQEKPSFSAGRPGWQVGGSGRARTWLTEACSLSARSQKQQPIWFPHCPTAAGGGEEREAR